MTPRLYRFRLTTLLIAVTLFCGGLAWYTTMTRHRAAERRAINMIREFHAPVTLAYEGSSDSWCATGNHGDIDLNWTGPKWLRGPMSRCGLDGMYRVNEVFLVGSRWDDRVIPHLLEFSSIKRIRLAGTGHTERGVQKLLSALPQATIEFTPPPEPDLLPGGFF